MSAKLWSTGTINAFSTTLNGAVSIGANSIVLTSVTGLQAPGVLVIDRVDSNNVATPNSREYISYTGISTLTLTGVTKGLGGSSDAAHNSGAVVEEVISVTQWNDLVSFLQVSHDSAGKIVTSAPTLSNPRITGSLNASGATGAIDTLIINTTLNVSGASTIGNFPITPAWVIGGGVSLATTVVGKPLPMPQNGLYQFFSAVLRTPASGASLILDINKNGTTIFGDQNTRLLIVPGGTFVSTASIGTKSFVAGDIFTVDIDAGGGSGSDLTIIGQAR